MAVIPHVLRIREKVGDWLAAIAKGRGDLACLFAQLFLGLAFVVEGLLFAFHLKGSMLDWSLHLLLVLLVLAAALVCFAEYR